MTQEAIKIEARLSALEYLVQRLHAIAYIAGNTSPEKIKQGHADLLQHISLQEYPSNDPALSGLISGEIEDALSSSLAGIEQMTARIRARKDRTPSDG
jgi:hypothetical protein